MPCSITVVRVRAVVPEQLVEVGDVRDRGGRPGRPAGAGCSARRPSGCCARRRPPAGRAGRGQPVAGQVELVGALQHDHVDVARRAAPRAAPPRPSPASRRCGPGRRPSRAAVGRRPGPGSRCLPWTNAVVQEPCTCQSRMFTRRPPLPAGRASRCDRRATTLGRLDRGQAGMARHRAVARPGVPAAARRRRRGARSAPGTGPTAERDGRGEQADHRGADRGGQVGGAGVADDHAAAPASTPASSASVGAAAEVDTGRAPATGRSARARPARR